MDPDQPITYCNPTCVSSVALNAWSDTDHVWSPTIPSAATPAQVWKAATDARVRGPNSPSTDPGVVFHWPGAPLVRTLYKLRTTAPVDPSRSVGIGPPS